MSKYTLNRIGHAFITVIGVSIIIFVLARLLPGDPARVALGPTATEEAVQMLREELHLDQPIPVQYYIWARDLLTGHLGRSLVTTRDVLQDLTLFLPATLELVIFSALFHVILGITLGVIAGRKANTWIDNTIRMFSYLGVSIPSFVYAIIFILVFVYVLGWFPLGGRLSPGIPNPPTITGMITIDSLISGNFATFINALWHLILPAFSVCLGRVAQESRITRSSIIENLNKDYMVSATSHGMPQRTLTFKYLLKPSLIPTVSVMGLDIASMISGTFLVEVVFSWPGFSKYGVIAMLAKDLNAIVAVVVVVSFVFVVANIVVDLIVAYLDPRVRIAEHRR